MSDSDSGRESPVVNFRHRAAYQHPKLVDDDWNTDLHYFAARNDVSAITRYLNKMPQAVDAENYLGWTPLMMACRKGHHETVRCLLTFNANATMKNRFGINVFQISIPSGNLQMITFLLEHLLTGGVPRSFLEHSFSVASLAILFRYQAILEYLIDQDFMTEGGTINTGITPFMFAHAMENDQAISILLKHKVDTKAKNYLGHTAVDIATIRKQMKVIHSTEPRIVIHKTVVEESVQNELQNQHLRNALQVKPNEGSSAKSNISKSSQILTQHPGIPYIIYSPYPVTPNLKFLTVPGTILTHGRKSSNMSPFAIPMPPNISPISPLLTQMGGQIFFPPDFSPSHSPFNSTSQVYSQSQNISEFLNARINTSTGIFLSPAPVLNVM